MREMRTNGARRRAWLYNRSSRDEKRKPWVGHYVMKISLGSTIALSAICAITALTASDQPKFEVASVKRMDRGIIHNSMGPGTVTLKGDPLKIVLMEAFKVKSYQIEGPSWLDEDCFDIVAKMPEGATSDQIPAML